MRWTAVACAALALVTAGVGAEQPRAGVFTFERPIIVDGSGPRRLAFDVPLLVGTQPFVVTSADYDAATATMRPVFGRGAADLRLVDANGAEVPYLLVPPSKVQPIWSPAAVEPVAPVETDKARTSGFEVDLARPARVDAIRLAGLPVPFLKRARLEGSGDRAHWTLLADEGTLFDLPSEHLEQTSLAFSAGTFQYLRLTWDDRFSGRLPLPRQVFARLAPGPARSDVQLVQPLAFERRPSEPRVSRFRVRLPAPRLPIVALVLDVNGGHLLRPVTVYEARVAGTEAQPHALGTGTLKRVVQDGVTAASLRVAISPPQEAQLDIEVNDGDSGPLDLTKVSAEFGELPWIYFEAKSGTLTARYGDRLLAPARYDLEAVRSELKIEEVADASWGEAARHEPTEAAAPPPLPTVGAALDATGFRYVRAVPSGERALVRLGLDAPVLAHTAGISGQFSDVRVLDPSNRQVPYLVERAAEPISLDLRLEPATAPKRLAPSRSARSFYRVHLPYDRLPSPRLVLSTTAGVFARQLMLVGERPADAAHRDPWIVTVADVAWVHRDEGVASPPLVVPISPLAGQDLTLVVDEGDNAPLPISGARLLLPAYCLRFFRERDASLRLAYGREDLGAPRYDLALLAPQLIGAAAIDVVPAAESAAPGASGPGAMLVSPRLFWAVLVIAVVVLVALIVRLVRKDGQVG